MNPRRSFIRKIVYLVAIAVLLVPLALLGQPARSAGPGRQGSPGGLLARMRLDAGMSQANLGELDPTSETMRLATLGLRGVAANILWTKAFAAQREEDWSTLSATYEQITNLMPNYITAWRNQAWNLAYNVSVEWDDYNDRYFWVIKGINFGREGVRFNQRAPLLRWEVGWIISQKIGRADEKVLFRRLFREDDDFHGERPLPRRDNWLVGKEWFLQGIDLVDNQGVALRGKNPVVFYTDPAMSQIYYATAIEEEGTFGEVAMVAWSRAAEDWQAFGERQLQLSEGDIRLVDFDLFLDLHQQKAQALHELQPDLQAQLFEAKVNLLPEADQELIRREPKDYTREEIERLYELQPEVTVTYQDIAENLPTNLRPQGRELARDAQIYLSKLDTIDNYRNQVNYLYWKTRCRAETEQDALDARRLIYEGDRAYVDRGNLDVARENYEAGFEKWRVVFDKYPKLVEDVLTGEELLKTIGRYNEILERADESFPEPFILQDVLDMHLPPLPPEEPVPAGP